MKKTTKKSVTNKKNKLSKDEYTKAPKALGVVAIVAGVLCFVALLLFIPPISNNSEVSRNNNNTDVLGWLSVSQMRAEENYYENYNSFIQLVKGRWGIGGTVLFSIPDKLLETGYTEVYLYKNTLSYANRFKSTTVIGNNKKWTIRGFFRPGNNTFCVEVLSHTKINENLIAHHSRCGKFQ